MKITKGLARDKAFSTRVSEEVLKGLDELCDIYEMSRSDFIEIAVINEHKELDEHSRIIMARFNKNRKKS